MARSTVSPSTVREPLQLLKHHLAFIFRRYQKLPVYGKLFIWLVFFFYICLGAFIIIVTPGRIAQFLYDRARALAETRLGWLALAGAIVCISFPPLVGHTTLVTLCGFAYGMKGFFIALSASIVGAGLVFTILRFLFSKKLRQWSGRNNKWKALESVVRAKGLPLIILIRISPFPPWVYSNSLFASIEPVSLWEFIAATLFVSPKLLLHVFIGSRIATLSDGDQRSHMDTQTKVINSLLIAGGVIVAIFTSWWVYTLVQNHIRHLDGVSQETDELAAEAIEDLDEEAPLLRPPSPVGRNQT